MGFQGVPGGTVADQSLDGRFETEPLLTRLIVVPDASCQGPASTSAHSNEYKYALCAHPFNLSENVRVNLHDRSTISNDKC